MHRRIKAEANGGKRGMQHAIGNGRYAKVRLADAWDAHKAGWMRPMAGRAVQGQALGRMPRREVKQVYFSIAKTGGDEHMVFGWAWVARTPQGGAVVDSQGDAIEPQELERAAYRHVLEFRSAGEGHDPGLRGVGVLIESVVFTPEKRAAMGIGQAAPDGWWVGYLIRDEATWERIVSGEYAMFSIEGEAYREEGAGA